LGGAILDEGNLLAEEVLALGEGSELTEELAESFLSHLPADITHEKLGLSFVLGVHLCRGCLEFTFRCCFFRFRLLAIILLAALLVAILDNSRIVAGEASLLLWLEIV